MKLKRTLFLGLSGRARHGKTESTDAIIEQATADGFDARIYDIGGIIRRVAIAQGRLPNIERKYMTKEQLEVVLEVGAEGRAVHPNYWVNQWIETVRVDAPDIAVCPNVRLPQEADAVHNFPGGYIARIVRLNPNGSLYISPDRPPNDITETALEFWPADFYLYHKEADDALWVRMQAIMLYKYLLVREGYSGGV